MKYIYIVNSFILIFLSFVISCSNMNDLHDIYLQKGEKTYIGRVDSIHSFGGRERVLIRYWITDPRVKKLHIFWNQKRDSVIVSVPVHNPVAPLEVMIGDGNGSIKEGDHTFFFYSHDDRGHRSVVFESLINVYGDRYQSTLINRSLRSKAKSGENQLTLTWSGRGNENEIGVEISFTEKSSGSLKDIFIPTTQLSVPTIIVDIDLQKEISYRTWFKPDSESIDSFAAPNVSIQI